MMGLDQKDTASLKQEWQVERMMKHKHCSVTKKGVLLQVRTCVAGLQEPEHKKPTSSLLSTRPL